MIDQQAYKLGQRKVLTDIITFLVVHKDLTSESISLLDFLYNYEVKDFQEIIWPEG